MQKKQKMGQIKKKWTRAKQLRRHLTEKCCLPVARKCTFCHQELSKLSHCLLQYHYKTIQQCVVLWHSCTYFVMCNIIIKKVGARSALRTFCHQEQSKLSHLLLVRHTCETLLICNINTKLSNNVFIKGLSLYSCCGTVAATS